MNIYLKINIKIQTDKLIDKAVINSVFFSISKYQLNVSTVFKNTN